MPGTGDDGTGGGGGALGAWEKLTDVKAVSSTRAVTVTIACLIIGSSVRIGPRLEIRARAGRRFNS